MGEQIGLAPSKMPHSDVIAATVTSHTAVARRPICYGNAVILDVYYCVLWTIISERLFVIDTTLHNVCTELTSGYLKVFGNYTLIRLQVQVVQHVNRLYMYNKK